MRLVWVLAIATLTACSSNGLAASPAAPRGTAMKRAGEPAPNVLVCLAPFVGKAGVYPWFYAGGTIRSGTFVANAKGAHWQRVRVVAYTGRSKRAAYTPL